jgi:hypothetical protein
LCLDQFALPGNFVPQNEVVHPGITRICAAVTHPGGDGFVFQLKDNEFIVQVIYPIKHIQHRTQAGDTIVTHCIQKMFAYCTCDSPYFNPYESAAQDQVRHPRQTISSAEPK